MDQQPDNASPLDPVCGETVEPTRSGEISKGPQSRRERGSGDHAIERIAAAARALAENDRADGKSVTTSTEGRKSPRTALIPAPAAVHRSKQAAASPKATRIPSYLPLYAAALCLALGIGGVLGGQLGSKQDLTADAETAKIERALPWKREMAEGQVRDTTKVRDDLKTLRGEIAALRANNDQLRQAESQKQVQELRAMRATMEAQKAETASLKADLGARFDRADRDATQRTDKTAERMDRLEKRLADPVITGAITKPTAEPVKPEKLPVRGIVLRDVAQGVALIETKRGLMEVMPGDSIPGAGRVETIEKHAGKWRIVTSTGFIDDRME